MLEPPGIRADSPEGKRDEVILKCRTKGKSFIISLVYNMILITTCTVYAVKTRKIPENFNESKFIGFTMYTTIVIWLAFVTMFFGTNNSYEVSAATGIYVAQGAPSGARDRNRRRRAPEVMHEWLREDKLRTGCDMCILHLLASNCLRKHVSCHSYTQPSTRGPSLRAAGPIATSGGANSRALERWVRVIISLGRRRHLY